MKARPFRSCCGVTVDGAALPCALTVTRVGRIPATVWAGGRDLPGVSGFGAIKRSPSKVLLKEVGCPVFPRGIP